MDNIGATIVRVIATGLAAMLLIAAPASAKERSFVLGGFERIAVEGNIVVDVATGASPGAKAEGTQDQLDRVRLVRRGDTLTASLLSPVRTGRDNADITGPLVVRLSTRKLSELRLRGNGKLSVASLDDRSARVSLVGGGVIAIGTVKADQFYVNVAGTGVVSVGGGSAREGHVQLSGPATLKAASMVLDRLDLNHSGPATSAIEVKEFAKVENSGTGSIAIGGEADCDIRSAGSAQIVCGNGKDLRQR